MLNWNRLASLFFTGSSRQRIVSLAIILCVFFRQQCTWIQKQDSNDINSDTTINGKSKEAWNGCVGGCGEKNVGKQGGEEAGRCV